MLVKVNSPYGGAITVNTEQIQYYKPKEATEPQSLALIIMANGDVLTTKHTVEQLDQICLRPIIYQASSKVEQFDGAY